VSELTRAELIEHIKARRVVIGAQRLNKVHVTIDTGKTTTQAWVDRDWVKPMLTGQVEVKR
jgi:hypothetical protein